MSTPSPAPSRAAQVLVVLLPLLLAVLVMELGVRGWDVWRGKGFFFGGRNQIERAKTKWVPFRTNGFTPYRDSNGSRSIASIHGEFFALDKPDDTIRIVCFGASTTVNKYSVQHGGGHYPERLQLLLRQRLERPVEVINVANPSYSTAHSIILLALDVLSWEPDVVILMQNFADLTATFYPGFTHDYSHMYRHPQFVPGHGSNFGVADVLFQFSQVYWIARNRTRNAISNIVGTPDIERVSHGAEPLALGQQVYRRNLLSFVALAQSRGIRVVLATQAFHDDEEFMDTFLTNRFFKGIEEYPLHDEVVRQHDFYNEILEDVARRKATWYVDNRVIREVKDYFIDPVHFTPDGVKALSFNYADRLAPLIAAELPTRPASARAPGSSPQPGQHEADRAAGGVGDHVVQAGETTREQEL